MSWLATSASAQTHLAAIRGSVTDPSGAGVAGAALSATHEETSVTRVATSGGGGNFSLTQLPPGPYRVRVELAGYKTCVNRAVLQVNQQLRIDVALEVGVVTEQIVVSAPDVPVDQESVALATVIGNSQIVEMPLDGRNFLELTLLAPGASPGAQGSAGSVRGDFTFSVNGARENANSFLLDGGYNVDPKLNTSAVRPPVDAIREFKVVTSTYDASFGRHAGGQVNVLTNAGANRFSGTAYEFFRHDGLNARNAFAPRNAAAPAYERNQFGMSFGGPIVRNRTFFFVDYEGTRLREGITRVTNVPTPAERRGDFSASLMPAPADPFTGQPFPDGKIPTSRIHPIGAAVANLYPAPNRNVPFENFVSSPAVRDRNDHIDLRLDHSFGNASELMVRYSLGDRRLFDPFSGSGFAAVPGFGTNVPRRAQNLVVSETHLFSPSMVNDVRVVFNRVAAGAFHENQGTSINNAVGLPELSSDPRDFGLSFVTVSGFSPLGDEFNNPQDSATSMVQALDTLTYARGAHLLKVGFDARFTRQNAFRDVQSRGLLTFSNQPAITGNALADLLLGLPLLTGGARLDNPQRLRSESYNVFVQDEVRLGSTLTLSAGLRYEITSPPVDAGDRANVFDAESQTLVQVGMNGMPRSGYRTDKNNWAPRIGLAWTPDDRATTVLRGGYGIYYNQSPLAPGEGLFFNPPFFNFNLFFSLPGLPLTLSDPFPGAFPLPTPPSALTFQRDLRTPALQQWSASLQRQLGGRRAVEVAYVGSKGSNLLRGRDVNQALPSPEAFNLRPNPLFGDIIALESKASSRYDGFQVKLQQRLHGGLSVLGAYTVGKSRDDASGFFSSTGDPNFPQDSNDPAAEWGRSNFDVRHRFSLSFSYKLPFGAGRRFAGAAGWLSGVVSDWQLAGILTLQSGRPFTVALLPEIDNSNTGRAALGFGTNDRPNLVGEPSLSNRSPDRWFATDAFAFPAFGNFGGAGRNILDGPGFQNLNLALLKRARLTADLDLQIRIEAFNVLNHVNLSLPDNFLGSPTFGRILSAGSARRMQLGLKLIY